jgi:hypothetical protein
MENMNGFRKWFLALRKVSSGENIINKFLMNHQVFAEKYMNSYVASTGPS